MMGSVRRAVREDSAPRSGPARRWLGADRLARRPWPWLGLAVLVTGGAAAAVLAAWPASQPLLAASFDRPNGLVTNEFAYFNPGDPAGVVSPVWIVTSGSLFARGGAGWTGVPDIGPTGPRSAAHTDSSVFRAVTRRADFQNVVVSFSLEVQRFLTVPGGQPPSWQGVHVFLRYRSPQLLYAVSVNRRDGTVVIKKKVPGGPSNGGTYYTLASAHTAAVVGRWQRVRVSAVNNGGHAVVLRVWLDGRPALRATDTGAGGVPAITSPGRVGLRGDFTEFMFRKFVVSRDLPGSQGCPAGLGTCVAVSHQPGVRPRRSHAGWPSPRRGRTRWPRWAAAGSGECEREAVQHEPSGGWHGG